MIANLMGGDGLYVIIIALVVLVGGSQLPKIARNVGLAGKEFRSAQAEAEDDIKKRKSKEDKAAAPAELPPVADVAPAPAAAPAPVAATPAAEAQAGGEPAITLTPAQLDALLKAREEQVRGESNN